jgi:hypothetical protein
MRVVVFAKANEAAEQGMVPTPKMLEAFAAMDRVIEELTAAGVLVAAAGLKPSSEGKRIICDGAERTVIDGPFAEARELVAGFSIWKGPASSRAREPAAEALMSGSSDNVAKRIWAMSIFELFVRRSGAA